MRDYLYISESKINKYYSEVPKSWFYKFCKGFSLSAKWGGVSISTNKTKQVDLLTKLAAIEKWFEEKQGLQGGLDDGTAFIKAELNLKGCNLLDKVVFFSSLSDQFAVGLGGSLSNVTGCGPDNSGKSYSALPLLLDVLLESRTENLLVPARQNPPETLVLGVVEELCRDAIGLPIKMEFLAKTLHSSTRTRGDAPKPRDRSVILGSPLFVAEVL